MCQTSMHKYKKQKVRVLWYCMLSFWISCPRYQLSFLYFQARYSFHYLHTKQNAHFSSFTSNPILNQFCMDKGNKQFSPKQIQAGAELQGDIQVFPVAIAPDFLRRDVLLRLKEEDAYLYQIWPKNETHFYTTATNFK